MAIQLAILPLRYVFIFYSVGILSNLARCLPLYINIFKLFETKRNFFYNITQLTVKKETSIKCFQTNNRH